MSVWPLKNSKKISPAKNPKKNIFTKKIQTKKYFAPKIRKTFNHSKFSKSTKYYTFQKHKTSKNKGTTSVNFKIKSTRRKFPILISLAHIWANTCTSFEQLVKVPMYFSDIFEKRCPFCLDLYRQVWKSNCYTWLAY